MEGAGRGQQKGWTGPVLAGGAANVPAPGITQSPSASLLCSVSPASP